MSKIRAIVNGVSFYTTDTGIKRGVGDFSSINTAVQICRNMMGEGFGFGKTFTFYDEKMRKSEISVQLSRV